MFKPRFICNIACALREFFSLWFFCYLYIVMLFQVQFMLDHLKFILWPEQCSVRFVHGLSTLVLTTNKITFCTQELDFHKRSGIWMESRLIFKENFFCWLASHNLLFVFKYECSGLKSNILIFKGDVNFMSSLGVLIGPGINQCLYPICGHLIWFSATNNNFPCFYAFLVRKVSVFT